MSEPLETGQLRKAAGAGLPCRRPCKGIGRLSNVAPDNMGWIVTCDTCGRTSAAMHTAGEAVAAWTKENE